MIALEATTFSAVTRAALAAIRVDESSLEHVVGATVEASLPGVDSHGIKLLPHYHRAAQAGWVNRLPHFQVTKRSAAAALLDAITRSDITPPSSRSSSLKSWRARAASALVDSVNSMPTRRFSRRPIGCPR